jgi:hypothetical protein
VPGGQKQDTSLIHGLMFTKNIAHKKMKQQIGNPHILLLRGSIEYQRVENKFSSLEPQILQVRMKIFFLFHAVPHPPPHRQAKCNDILERKKLRLLFMQSRVVK